MKAKIGRFLCFWAFGGLSSALPFLLDDNLTPLGKIYFGVNIILLLVGLILREIEG